MSIVHFVIKTPKLVQMIVSISRVQDKKYPLSIQDGRQKSKMAATKLSFLIFPHKTAVISCASSRSPFFFFLGQNIGMSSLKIWTPTRFWVRGALPAFKRVK